MRRATRTKAVTVLLLLCLSTVAVQRNREAGSARAPAPAGSEDGISVYFSPEGGALAAVVREIDGARKSLDVQAYLLTTKEIAGPIAKAHGRGVKVRVVMDDENAGRQYSAATYLANAGVPVWLDGDHKEAHNKVMLVDGRTVITGSFNFTKAADRANAENLLVIENKPRLFAAYLKNFESHVRHLKPYERKN